LLPGERESGSRIITNVVGIENTVYPLSIYDKAEKESLSDKELFQLLKSIS